MGAQAQAQEQVQEQVQVEVSPASRDDRGVVRPGPEAASRGDRTLTGRWH